jgi:transporter family protein
MTWLALSLLSALFLGLYDVAKKASVNNNAVIPVLFACSATGALLMLPCCLLTWWDPVLAGHWGVRIVALSPTAHALVLLKAGIVTTSWLLTFFALKALPISLAAPIRASAPLFTLLGAVALFGERPNTAQWFGIAITLAAYFAFSVIGRSEGIHFSRNRWVWMLALGTLVGAISGLYDKQLLQGARLPAAPMQLWFTLYNTLLQGVILILFWRPVHRQVTPFRWRWSIPAVAGLLLLADALYFHALAQPHALVSVVATLRRSNVVVSFAVGGLAFHERHRGKKALALGGVLAGLFLIMK